MKWSQPMKYVSTSQASFRIPSASSTDSEAGDRGASDWGAAVHSLWADSPGWRGEEAKPCPDKRPHISHSCLQGHLLNIHAQRVSLEVNLPIVLFSRIRLGWEMCVQTHEDPVKGKVLASVTSDALWPMDCSLPGSSVHGDSPGKNTGVGCHGLLQGIFPTQGLNPALLHCRQTL